MQLQGALNIWEYIGSPCTVLAQSMRNEQDQLEAPVLSQSHDITGISETWWDKSHDCSVGMEAYRLLRRARPGRRVKVLHHVQGRD